MKYAVISDIHGNVIALENALKEIQRFNVDKIICLGDFVGIGPCPEQTIQMLKTLGDKLIVVKGNHEDRVINGLPDYLHDNKLKVTEKERAHARWVFETLSPESREYITNLPEEITLQDGNRKIAVMHYPSDENNQYWPFLFYPKKEENETLFRKYDADVVLFGHTHVTYAKCYEGRYYFNPGSLGLPDYRTYGTYGILEVTDEKIDYNEYDFQYDYNRVLEIMNEINYPQLDVMKRLFFGTKWWN